MTSNIGGEEFTSKASQIGFSTDEKEEKRIIKDYETIKEKVISELDDYFAPEFINRIDKIVVFAPLDVKSMEKIIRIQLERLSVRLKQIGITLTFDPKVIKFIQKETYDPAYGARPVRRYIQDKIEDEVAQLLIAKEKPDTIAVNLSKGVLIFSPLPSRS